jgi:hypothetical protein
MVAGTTYLLYVTNVGKAVIKIETTQIAKYSAETGIYQMKSQLGVLNTIIDTSDGKKVINEWYKAKNFDGQYIFPLKSGTESGRSAETTARLSGLITLKDFNTNVLGVYKVSIEDGTKLSETGKTLTGSVIEGTDRYNNNIWSTASERDPNVDIDKLDDKNVFTRNDKKFFRYGIRVDGYAINGAGKSILRAQSVYALLEIPQSTDVIKPGSGTSTNPSSFLLSTNGKDDLGNNIPLTLYSNQIITGPIHTNEDFAFRWRGNFNVSYWSSNTPSSINDRFTVFTKRAATTFDQTPPLVSGIVRESNDAANQFTIFGTNFSSNNAANYISFNGGTNWINPTSTLVNSTSPTIGTKLKSITIPGYAVTSGNPAVYNIILAVGTSYLRLSVPVDDLTKIQPVNPAPNPLDLDILGIMQAFKHRDILTDIIYTQTNRDGSGSGDYRFAKYPGYPYVIDWAPPGNEPDLNDEYIVTYITNYNLPQQKINVYGQLTYGGASPKLYYLHGHRAPYTSALKPYASDHGHNGNIFDMSNVDLMPAKSPEDYSLDCSLVTGWWNCNHTHELSGYPLGTSATPSFTNDRMFKWGNDNISYKPAFINTKKLAPILKPNNVNFYTQREYVNQIFKLILDKTLPSDNTGRLDNPNKIPEDREKGYYSGSQDFRATYFSNDLKYSNGTLVLPAGSPLSATATIYVNDNPDSVDYLKISATPISTDYKFYTYRQIPRNAPTLVNKGTGLKDLDGGIIFVNEGVVKIGGLSGQKGVVYTGYRGADTFGRNTIIDGRLVIISYSEKKPANYINTDLNSTTDNPGDIVITGNVIYKNKVYKYHDKETIPADKDKIRQYTYEDGSRQYEARFNDKNGNNINTPQPSTILDVLYSDNSRVPWVTEKDGSLTKDGSGNILVDSNNRAKVNGLALIASNDIKIPVMQYYQDLNENTFDPKLLSDPTSKQDLLVIHGQLIAGHQLTQTKAGTNNSSTSKNDQLIMYGSFYSNIPPNFSYFDRDNPTNTAEESISRLYLLDKSILQVPLTGIPYFPKDSTYTGDAQYISGLDLPKIVPGSWKLVTDGS